MASETSRPGCTNPLSPDGSLRRAIDQHCRRPSAARPIDVDCFTTAHDGDRSVWVCAVAFPPPDFESPDMLRAFSHMPVRQHWRRFGRWCEKCRRTVRRVFRRFRPLSVRRTAATAIRRMSNCWPGDAIRRGNSTRDRRRRSSAATRITPAFAHRQRGPESPAHAAHEARKRRGGRSAR